VTGRRSAAHHALRIYPSGMRLFIAALSAVLLAAACASCGIADVAPKATHGQVRPVMAGTAASEGDVPETLSAATAAAQANVDHFSSGDFAGVWERMSREVRDGITQQDFVTFYETCKKVGSKIRVAGVSLDLANGEAVVSMKVDGADKPRIMLFENGTWVMKPTPGFAAHLGKPVQQIVAEEQSAGLCSD